MESWTFHKDSTANLADRTGTKRNPSLTIKRGRQPTSSSSPQRQHNLTMYFIVNIIALVFFFFFVCVTNADTHVEKREAIVKEDYEEKNFMNNLPWTIGDEKDDGQAPLSRSRRSASNSSSGGSIWDEIEEFYSDKNNMAMYCVLPIMVLIYGGCSAIYCVHKCRQYVKRRKHKRLKEEDCDSLNSDKNDLNQKEKSLTQQDNDRPISQISQAWTDIGDTNDNVKWSGQTEASHSKSPLPWQITEKTTAAAMLAQNTRASYVNDRLRDDDISLEEGRRSRGHDARSSSRTSTLDDALIDEELHHGSRNNHSEKLTFVAAAAATNIDFGESTDDHPNVSQKYQAKEFQQHRSEQGRRIRHNNINEESRTQANLNDYTSRTSKIKATDYSRFAEAKPIEIVPLSADPSLRVWDPLHRRPWGEKSQSRASSSSKVQPVGEASGRPDSSVNQMKEEMLARYDALSTFQMAKKAAEILKTNAVEKNPFQRKPNKKKHIFIAE